MGEKNLAFLDGQSGLRLMEGFMSLKVFWFETFLKSFETLKK